MENEKTLEEVSKQFGKEPNVVTDIYKLRGGENTQTRVWSRMDLGTLRKEDLFVTNSRLELVDIGYEKTEFDVDGIEDLMEVAANFMSDFNKEVRK